jgi:hypothetical protein
VRSFDFFDRFMYSFHFSLAELLGEVLFAFIEPSLRGNGNLMKDQAIVQDEPQIDFSGSNPVIGVAVACGF